jgi:hypothetical protein
VIRFAVVFDLDIIGLGLIIGINPFFTVLHLGPVIIQIDAGNSGIMPGDLDGDV